MYYSCIIYLVSHSRLQRSPRCLLWFVCFLRKRQRSYPRSRSGPHLWWPQAWPPLVDVDFALLGSFCVRVLSGEAKGIHKLWTIFSLTGVFHQIMTEQKELWLTNFVVTDEVWTRWRTTWEQRVPCQKSNPAVLIKITHASWHSTVRFVYCHELDSETLHVDH